MLSQITVKKYFMADILPVTVTFISDAVAPRGIQN